MAVDHWHACVAHERRIQVVVAAAARPWHQDDGRVPLPRFTDWGATYVRPSRERSAVPAVTDVPCPDGPLTHGSMATALCEAVGGLPASLHQEPGGEVAFSVPLRDAR
ncbi:hypothetical protein ACWDCX_04740 [Streptomyces fungicidicus]|uniref:hypothetical protein n=1 Tax=Streptomyces sp. NA02536 TaxID=2742133 RepID=UPI0015920D41|nr:hypothetical protein [Streptomyces sp. NA02536]QKV98488.1 hypothetical protein HUT14_00820 [Streptomyces sp. NA02536]